MLRWFILSAAVLLLALSSLTIVQSPARVPWKLAVLAGEFGHWLALLPLALAVAAWFGRGENHLITVAAIAVCAAATSLFVKPCFQASAVGLALARELASKFGPTLVSRPVFSFLELGAADPEPVAIESFEVTGLPLDFYRAMRTDGRAAPGVIIVHGGGWDGGDRKQIIPFNHWLARQGYAVAAISYRLAPKFRWPAPREDVLAAIAFLKSRASALGIDPAKLVLAGRSAGGQIALTVGYTASDPAIRGVMGFYAPSDLAFGYAHTTEDDAIHSPHLMRQYLGGPPEAARENYDAASALFHVTRNTPPTLLLHGEHDALVWHRHSVRLEARLREAGVPCVFVSLPWATHAFDYNLHGPGGQVTLFAVERFLAAVTK